MPRSRGVPVLLRNKSNLKKVHVVNNTENPVAHSSAYEEPSHVVRVSIKPTRNRRSTIKQIRDAVQNAATAFTRRFTRSKNAKIHATTTSDNFTGIGGRKRRTKRYAK